MDLDLIYTIRSFDQANKRITVDFTDGNWAEIPLIYPIPKNKEELEKGLKRYAKCIEDIQAPDVDLSYILPLVGIPQSCARNSITPVQMPKPPLDPEIEAGIARFEQEQFDKKVVQTLINLGVVVVSPENDA